MGGLPVQIPAHAALRVRLRSRRVSGLASRYPLPVVDVGFE